MGFIARWFTRIVALVSFVGIVMWSRNVWIHNDLALASAAFGASMVLRATALAWLRRHDDVQAFFRTKATAFIQTPLEELAFVAPIWATPAVFTNYGFLYAGATLFGGWAVLRFVVKVILQRTSGGTHTG